MILLIAMIPVIELRGAIPAAIVIYGMDPIQAFALGVIGNMIPVVFIFYLLDPIASFTSARSETCRKFFDWVYARAEKHGKEKVEKYKDLALAVFVGIPLPMTGAWTGTAISLVFGFPFRKAFLSVILGVIIAGIIVTVLTVTGFSLWDAVKMING